MKNHASTTYDGWLSECQPYAHGVFRDRLDGDVFDSLFTCRNPHCRRCGPARVAAFVASLEHNLESHDTVYVSLSADDRAKRVDRIEDRLKRQASSARGWIELYGERTLMVSACDHSARRDPAEAMSSEDALALVRAETKFGFVTRGSGGGWKLDDAKNKKKVSRYELLGVIPASRIDEVARRTLPLLPDHDPGADDVWTPETYDRSDLTGNRLEREGRVWGEVASADDLAKLDEQEIDDAAFRNIAEIERALSHQRASDVRSLRSPKEHPRSHEATKDGRNLPNRASLVVGVMPDSGDLPSEQARPRFRRGAEAMLLAKLEEAQGRLSATSGRKRQERDDEIGGSP